MCKCGCKKTTQTGPANIGIWKSLVVVLRYATVYSSGIPMTGGKTDQSWG